MDLKSTKVMEQIITVSKFKNMALGQSIVKPLRELKSTCTSINQFKGLASEKAVIELLTKTGWQLEFQRAITKVAEIDLILTKKEKLILVEVKKLNQDWHAFERVGKKQFQSLQLNLNLFTHQFRDLHVSAYVAWVNQFNQVTFLSVE